MVALFFSQYNRKAVLRGAYRFCSPVITAVRGGAVNECVVTASRVSCIWTAV